jgi:excinuclease ABC subunit A
MGMITDGLNKPKVDSIEGLSPSIAIGQRVLSNNPRSTVGTYTEILTYLRILYAELGTRICPSCGNSIPPNFEEVNESELDAKETSCPYCKIKLKPLTMASFSFNKTEGACPKCKGLGTHVTVDYSKLVNENLTIAEGAFSFCSNVYRNVSKVC